MPKKVVCEVKYLREPRPYTAKALMRIYCNYLSDTEALEFRRQFFESKGDCGHDLRPCEDLADKLDQAIASVKEIAEASNEIQDDVQGVVSAIGEEIDGAISGVVNNIADYIGGEEYQSSLDDFLEPYIENPIERGTAVSAISKGSMIAGFVDQDMVKRFEEINSKKKIEARIDLSRAMNKRLALAVASLTALVVFFKGVYDVYVETCTEDK